MAAPREAEPVKLLVGMLSAFPDALEAAEQRLVERWGDISAATEAKPHKFTGYYAREMGEHLLRRFVAFRQRISPSDLAGAKLATNDIEQELAAAGRWNVERPVNLDPGIVTPAKLVLASCKNYAHRIYLADGVCGEVTLSYVGNAWQSYPWTYPDYRTAEYHAFFDQVRAELMTQRKGAGAP
jgi:Domain of unknown function (DUF4416)